jgi:hypothetical protein
VNPGELERLRPSEGARFLLELDDARNPAGGGQPQARYRAWVLTSTGVFPYDAVLSDTGSAVLTSIGECAVPELAAMLEMIAKLTARAAAKKRDAGMPPWPNRIMRWRGTGRGQGQSSSSS